MKVFRCSDSGGDCPFVARGKSVEEVKQKVLAHAQQAHKDRLAKTDAERAQFSSQLDKLIKDEA